MRSIKYVNQNSSLRLCFNLAVLHPRVDVPLKNDRQVRECRQYNAEILVFFAQDEHVEYTVDAFKREKRDRSAEEAALALYKSFSSNTGRCLTLKKPAIIIFYI